MTAADLRNRLADIIWTSRFYSDTGHRAAEDVMAAVSDALGEDIAARLNATKKEAGR